MALDPTAVLAQIDDVLAHARAASQDSDVQMQAVATRCVAAVSRLAPPESDYVERARSIEGHAGYVADQVSGILQALRADIEAGYVRTLEELVHADVFSNFLDMAGELQRSGYKDAAAVIAGSVLEEHLRQLAEKNGVTTSKANGAPVKADTLNAELAKNGTYNALVHKQVGAWLALRNKAAHGYYSEYDQAQVAALIRDVLDFAAKHPA